MELTKLSDQSKSLLFMLRMEERDAELFRDILSMEYVHDMIYGHLDRLSEMGPVFKKMGIELNPDLVLTVVIDNFWTLCEKRDNSYRYRLKRILLNQTRNVIQNGMRAVAATLIGTDKVVVLLDCEGRKQKDAEAYAEQCAEQIRTEAEKNTGFSVSIGVSDYCPNRTMIWRAYEQSFRALEASFRAGTGRVLRYQRPQTAGRHLDHEEQERIKRQLIHALSTQDDKSGEEALRQFIDLLSVMDISESQVKSRCIILLSDIAKYCIKLGLEAEKLSEQVLSIVNEIFRAGTMDEIHKEMSRYLLNLSETLRPGKEAGRDIMDVAHAYIEQYFTEDLTLQNMADLSGYSTAHFSRCFKERYGINFVQYLKTTRLQNAKELLKKSDLTISEIAEKSGYRNLSYFSSDFKRETGISPQLYRLQGVHSIPPEPPLNRNPTSQSIPPDFHT